MTRGRQPNLKIVGKRPRISPLMGNESRSRTGRQATHARWGLDLSHEPPPAITHTGRPHPPRSSAPN
jgi:hypothetical protein